MIVYSQEVRWLTAYTLGLLGKKVLLRLQTARNVKKKEAREGIYSQQPKVFCNFEDGCTFAGKLFITHLSAGTRVYDAGH